MCVTVQKKKDGVIQEIEFGVIHAILSDTVARGSNMSTF
jgi:hypothetical protein